MSSQDVPYIRSIKNGLKKLAKEKGVAFFHVENQFLIERAVARMVRDRSLRESLIFKGGYVGLRVYHSPRYTTDLDAVVYRKGRQQTVDLIKAVMPENIGDHVWFSLIKVADLTGQSEYGGVRMEYRAGIGQPPVETKKSRIINIDIGIGDPVTPAPKKEMLPLTIGEGEISWFIYPVETIISEKLHPFVSLGEMNSRSKDMFDLYYLLPKANITILRKAISKTFNFRGDMVSESFLKLFEETDFSLMKRGWVSAVSSLEKAPDFETCRSEVINWLKSHRL